MNQVAEIKQGGAIALPGHTDLARMFKEQDGLAPVLNSIREKAYASALAHDPTTAKGREGLKSVAYEVSKTKAELDRQGKALTDEQRREVAAVNAGRSAASAFLDDLRDEIKRPAIEWEEKEGSRIQALKDRLAAFDSGRADAHCPSEQISAVISEIEGIETGEDWQEYQTEASLAKDRALIALRGNLDIAEKREADGRELEELRALKAEKDERERIARDAETAKAALANRADNARAYIEAIGNGMIGGQPQAYGILLYELETKLPPLIEELGDHADALHDLRAKTAASLREKSEEERIEREAREDAEAKANAERASAEAKAAAERQRVEDEARHKREVEAAAQRERERIAAEQQAEADARAKREADAAHREKIASDIADALRAMTGRATPEAIAEALIEGKIPHCTVRM